MTVYCSFDGLGLVILLRLQYILCVSDTKVRFIKLPFGRCVNESVILFRLFHGASSIASELLFSFIINENFHLF